MSEWLEWLRNDGEFSPRNVCFVFSSGPIAVNPTPATQIFLVDNNNVILTDNPGANNLLAQ